MIKLEEQLYFLTQALNLLPGNLYAKNREGKYLFYNAHYLDALRKNGIIGSDDDAIGKTDYELFGESTADQFKKNDRVVMDKELTTQHEETAKIEGLATKRFISLKKPLYDKQGKVAGVIGYSIEYTDIVIQSRSISLTQREIETLALIYSGNTVKQIAKKIGLSPRTVEDYIANIKSLRVLFPAACGVKCGDERIHS